MRIIAGKAKSLPLQSLPGEQTRPTTDRIKETLFNMIQFKIQNANFLDLFAGSGGIGLEAISRGAAQAVFVENNKKAASYIEKNIAFTKFNAESTLLCSDVLAALHRIEGNYHFDLVFMDPPYDQLLEKDVLLYLKDSKLIDEETLLIVEISLHTDTSYLKDAGYTITKEKKYKTNAHIFLKRSL